MKPILFIALLIVFGIPAIAHSLLRGFWLASVLSAAISAVALGGLIHGLNVQLSTFAAFVVASFFMLLVPTFLIGLAFNGSKRRVEHYERLRGSPVLNRRRLIFGLIGVAFGITVGLLIFTQTGSRDLPLKALLGALAFVGVGGWHVVVAYLEHKKTQRNAT